MAKSRPFSLRLSAETDALVTVEAHRTRRSKGAVIEALAEEALKMRLFPGLSFRGQDWERRPWVIGTALDVWQIIEAWRDFGSSDRMVQETDVTEPQLRLALAYHQRFPDEIEADTRRNSPTLDELRREYPDVELVDLGSEDA